MPTLDRDGATLHFEETGRGDPPVVFVHGWTCDHTYFSPQYDYFGRDHRVIAVDLRGHGGSDEATSYSIEAFADDVAWMLGQLGVTTSGAAKPVIVGHSMGALVSLALAAAHPDLAAAIVLVDAAPIVVTPELRPLLDSFAEQFGGPDHLEARRGIIEGMLFAPGDDPTRKEKILAHMLTAPQAVAAGAWGAIGTFDGPTAARAVTVPTLHIAASNPINDATTLRGLNPLIQTAQTVGAGHFNQLEVPDQVNAMLDRFVSSLSAPARPV